MEPANLIDGLEIKLRQLAAKTERQRAHYEAVLAENEQLKRALDRQQGIVNALRDKLESTQGEAESSAPTAPSTADPALSEERRRTIEFCLQEVDRCIAWLQRN